MNTHDDFLLDLFGMLDDDKFKIVRDKLPKEFSFGVKSIGDDDFITIVKKESEKVHKSFKIKDGSNPSINEMLKFTEEFAREIAKQKSTNPQGMSFGM